MKQERRREKRIKARLPITLEYPANASISACTENISLLGAYLESEEEIAIGTKLSIILTIPAYNAKDASATNIKCQGDVFRCNLARQIESRRLYGLGIFFSNFSRQEDRNRLADYLDFLIRQDEENVRQAAKQWEARRRKQPS